MESKANIGKHLTLEERNFIEQSLNQSMSFKSIAKVLSKDACTISKEVRNHRIQSEIPHQGIKKNHCKYKDNCHKMNICGLCCNKECKSCIICNYHCSDFKSDVCTNTDKAPYVCNGCLTRKSCRQVQYIYGALSSYKKYKENITESKMGIHLSDEELRRIDRFITPLIK